MKNLILISIISSTISAYANDSFGVNPIFTYGDIQKFDEITNLTPSKGNVEILEDSLNGYDLISTKKVYLSIGVQALQSFEINNGKYGFIGLGLYPTKNSYAKHQIHFHSKQDLESYNYAIPLNASDLDSLNTGDSIYWNSLGGVTFNLGLGTFPLTIGPKIGFEGGYSIYVEKKEGNKAYVEIRRLSTKTVGFVTGLILAYADKSQLTEKTEGVSLLIDLASDSGKEIYNKVIQEGRIDLAENSPEARVQIGDVNSLKILGINGKIALATPFVPVIEFSKSNETEEVLESRSNIWNERSSSDLAISRRIRSTRFFGNQNKIETSALVSKKIINGAEELKAQLFWFRKGNKIHFKHLRNSLDKLIAQTNLNELQTEFPYIRYNLGFAKIGFSLNFSSLALKKIKSVKNSSSSAELAIIIQRYWNSSSHFTKAIELIQQCGGDIKLEINGESIPRLIKLKDFSSPKDCSPDASVVEI